MSGLGVGLADDHVEAGDAGVGDERLDAVDHPLVTVLHRGGGHAGDVAAVVCLPFNCILVGGCISIGFVIIIIMVKIIIIIIITTIIKITMIANGL